jgi:hypothetical protein
MPETQTNKRWRWRRRAALVAALVVAAACVGYAIAPRAPDLTAFDPDEIARRETLMWRHYYDKRFAALFVDLYGLAREQQGFSPFDSARIAVAAARAARAFQPTTSRRDALAAVPPLADYFAVLATAAPEPVDVMAAARAELDWWQSRREAVAPDEYGVTIARVATLIYDVDNDDVLTFGLIRAQAMAYRDARDSRMTEADWTAIADQLAQAYGHLKQAVSRRSKLG